MRSVIARTAGLILPLLLLVSCSDTNSERGASGSPADGASSSRPGTPAGAQKAPLDRGFARPETTQALKTPAPGPATTAAGESPAKAWGASGGRYTYTQVNYSDLSPGGATLQGGYTIVVEPRKGTGQRVRHYEGDSGQAFIQSLSWSPSRLQVVSEQHEGLKGCRYAPPKVLLALPLADRASWSTTTDCVSESESTRVTATTKVLSHGMRDVAGYGRLEVWRVRTTMEVPFAGGDVTRLTVVIEDELSPALLVPVRQEKTTRSYDGDSQKSESRTLRTIVPPGSSNSSGRT